MIMRKLRSYYPQVTDGGEPYQQTSLARVRITVQDVNNIAPVFTRESYTEYIVENEPPGQWLTYFKNFKLLGLLT